MIKVGQIFEVEISIGDVVRDNNTFIDMVITEWAIVVGNYDSIYNSSFSINHDLWAALVYYGGKWQTFCWFLPNSFKTLICSDEQKGIKTILEPKNLKNLSDTLGNSSSVYFNNLAKTFGATPQ